MRSPPVRRIAWGIPFAPTIFLAFASFLVASCAVPTDFREGERIDINDAYVVLVPHYGRLDTVSIGLTRLEVGKPREDLIMTEVKTNQPNVLKVRPGLYYLRAVHVLRGQQKHTLDPRITLFQVKPSRINYPGDWTVNMVLVNSHVSGTVARGSMSAEYSIEYLVKEDPDIAALVQKYFPSLTAHLPLQFTRVDPRDLQPD